MPAAFRVLLMFMLAASAARAAETTMKPPVCTTEAQLKEHDGQIVTVVGTYRKRMSELKKRGPPVDLGHVAIIVDGRWIDLTELARPDEERLKLDGKQVRVTGRLVMRPHLKQPPHVAQIIPPPTLYEPGVVLPEP